MLKVSPSGYYACEKREAMPRRSSERLKVEVMIAHNRTRGVYGASRLHSELVANGVKVSLWKVKRLRRELGITLKRKKHFVRTTDSSHSLPVAPNRLERRFSPIEINRAWVSDITYIPTGEGWLYLAGIKDLYSKEIVGFSLSSNMRADLTLTALDKALRLHRPPAGLILHSDRGSQYCSSVYQDMLNKHNILCSMSKRGDCYDNAPMESFWSLLKNELVSRRNYRTRREAITELTEYIEVFYNRQRRQAALGYLSPAAFVKNMVKGKKLKNAA